MSINKTLEAIPRIMIDSKDYRKSVIRLYVFLKDYGKPCELKNTELTKASDMSLMSINYAVRLLVLHGFVKVEYGVRDGRNLRIITLLDND